MRYLIYLISFGFPLLVVTDLSSEMFESEFILNISRSLRIVLLLFFVIENLKNYHIIKKFYLFPVTTLFAITLFLYVFTDQNFFEGFWQYSKILFWVTGLNVLFLYSFKGHLSLHSFANTVRNVVLMAFLFTMIFLFSGQIEEDYNIASYLVLFTYPTLLLTSEGFKKHRIYLLFVAIAIFVTLKRGAIVGFMVSSALYYLTIVISSFRIRTILPAFVIISSFALIGYFSIQLQSARSQDRFTEEQFDLGNESAGSGRVGMYTRLYNEWKSAPMKTRIMGFGNQADSRRHEGRRTHAHSDIFGFLYNYGFVGIGLILLFYIRILKFYVKYRRVAKRHANIILIVFAILALVNLYSGMFRSTDAIYLFCLFPFLQNQKY